MVARHTNTIRGEIMTLCKPKNIENFICVTSDISIILSKLGFIPTHREVGFDRIYFLKNEGIIKEVGKLGVQT